MELKAEEGCHTVNQTNTMSSGGDNWSENVNRDMGWGVTGAGWPEGGQERGCLSWDPNDEKEPLFELDRQVLQQPDSDLGSRVLRMLEEKLHSAVSHSDIKCCTWPLAGCLFCFSRRGLPQLLADFTGSKLGLTFSIFQPSLPKSAWGRSAVFLLPFIPVL